MIGKTISHFRILAQLGGGGMGVVYRARDTKLGRDVALKFLPPHLADDPEAKSRFIQEAEAASALDHANICTIHEIGEARTDEAGAHQLFIAMTFYEGQTLKYRLQDGALSADESIRIARQIAEGLQRAHDNGIVHRDIKPANIMVTDRDEVKILDFGLAKLTGRIDLTQSGSTLGTAAYMSPEQVRGEAVDHRTDIWALGVVLYQMLTGERPFKGEYQHAISYNILHEEPAGFDELPAGVRDVVERCLQKDANDRFQTAAEMAEALDSLSDGSTTSSIQADDREEPRQSRRWIAAGVAIALLVAVVFGFMYWPMGPGGTSGQIAQESAADTAPDRQRLIVIPFANLGAPEDDYFADGISEEITMRLASLSDLAVISRNTAVRYRDAGKSTPEIGAELDVDYVLEGTVRWARQPDGSSLVRITPQLIRVSDDTNVWVDSYEGQVERIFEIQKEVAGRVAEELSLTLGSGETQGQQDAPTTNIEAYQAYLKAMTRMRSAALPIEKIVEVADLLEQALELDPSYLDASMLLTRVAAWLSFLTEGDDRLRYKEIADRLLAKTTALAAGSAQAAVARGYYSYYVGAEYERARSEFRSALELAPGLADAKTALAIIEKRLGNFEASIDLLEEGVHNDPMDGEAHVELAIVYMLIRRYDDALHEASLARALDGTLNCGMVALAIQVDGNFSRAARWQKELRRSGDRCVRVEWHGRDLNAALALYDTVAVPSDATKAAGFFARRAQLNRHGGRQEDEDHDWRMVLALTDSLKGSSNQLSTTGRHGFEMLSLRALARAALGNRRDALTALDRLRAGFGHDKLMSMTQRETEAEVFIMLGMHDEALDTLEEDFDGPGIIWPLSLATATYDPLRSNPRFQALVAKHPWP